MSDENDRPKLTVVADNPQLKRDALLERQFFDDALLQLAANIIRVVRGAGKPYEIILQCNEVVQTAIDFRDKTGDMPSDASVANTLQLQHEELTEYESFRSQRKLAMEQMVSGALRVAASTLLGQRLQIDHGEKEMQSAYRELERIHEERRKQREVAERAARARATPQRKPPKRKATSGKKAET